MFSYEIGIDLDQGHSVPKIFQQHSDTTDGNTFSETGDGSSTNYNVFWLKVSLKRVKVGRREKVPLISSFLLKGKIYKRCAKKKHYLEAFSQ